MFCWQLTGSHSQCSSCSPPSDQYQSEKVEVIAKQTVNNEKKKAKKRKYEVIALHSILIYIYIYICPKNIDAEVSFGVLHFLMKQDVPFCMLLLIHVYTLNIHLM